MNPAKIVVREVQNASGPRGWETMESRPEEFSATKSLNWLTDKPRRRREDALRRFLSPRPWPDAKASIVKRFKALRRKARMTQATLGDIIGICRQAVNEIENCRVYPHYTTIDRFSDLEARHECRNGTAPTLLALKASPRRTPKATFLPPFPQFFYNFTIRERTPGQLLKTFGLRQ
jgi:DNA-binding XRE family transcriptional regulator